ncbi:MAG TPA: TIR domain-containing protein [Verrucomicrobiae bacterium]|nr:TIR domain-containing protein [Verrucomicrobiae bacterium]
MKVFISWSGERSKKIAEIFRKWIPGVIQAVRPYFTPDDIAKGARWATEIAKELSDSKVGIFILTLENLTAPWIIFEAGAISKQLDSARVCPLLFGISPTDVKGPLEQFQCSSFSKEEIRKLLKSINAGLGDSGLDPAVLESVFEMWWPKLETEVFAILKTDSRPNSEPKRSEMDMLEELVLLSRRTHNAVERGGSVGSIHPVALNDLARHYSALVQLAYTSPPSPECARILLDMAGPIRHILTKAGSSSDAASDANAAFSAAYGRLRTFSDAEAQKLARARATEQATQDVKIAADDARTAA